MVMFMSQSSSKHTASVAARGRRRTPGREVQAIPVLDIRNQTSRDDVRPLAQGQVDDTGNSATCLQSYLQWAGFAGDTQNGEFGFGAYFLDDKPSEANSAPSSARMTEYTWTPSGRG
jgi:hypothetical protein